MSKALLVALREYMENMKTKAFWIGIGIFPVLFVLMIAVPVWMDKEKDVRKYAVIDRSGWLLNAAEEKAALPDIELILEVAEQRKKKGGKEYDEMDPLLKDLVSNPERSVEVKSLKMVASMRAQFAGPDGAQLIKLLAQSGQEVDDPIEAIMNLSKLPEVRVFVKASLKGSGCSDEEAEEALNQIDKTGDNYLAIKEFLKNLPAEEAKDFNSRLAQGRYHRIEVDPEDPDLEAKLKKMLNEEKLFAYFVISEDPVGKKPQGQVEPGAPMVIEEKGATDEKSDSENEPEDKGGCKYVSNNLTDMELNHWFTRHVNEAVYDQRLREANIAKAEADWLKERLVFEAKKVSDTGVEEEVAKEDTMRHWAPVVFVYLLWISVFTITQMLLTNTIEEKSNKIIEVLLSSVSPLQLMAGKIMGIACTGLTMVLSWIVFFLVGLKLMPVFIDKMPDFDLALIARDPIYLASFVGYFILGYLLLAAILVGIGSVCSSLKEAQNLMAPVTIIMIVPLLAMMPIGENPNGTIAKVMSYIPPFTPFVMMNRAAGPPTTMEYVVTTLLLLVSIVVALWAAAKIFRVGILMTGKPPKLMEMLKLIRAPVGHVQVRKDE